MSRYHPDYADKELTRIMRSTQFKIALYEMAVDYQDKLNKIRKVMMGDYGTERKKSSATAKTKP